MPKKLTEQPTCPTCAELAYHNPDWGVWICPKCGKTLGHAPLRPVRELDKGIQEAERGR